MNLTLYHYWRSSCSWRVRWALEVKSIAYEAIPTNLLSDEPRSEFYLQKNPSAYVPSLVVGDRVIAESMAILEWLEESYPEHSILPKDPFRRAIARQLAETINAGTQPIQNLSVMKKISENKEEQMEWNHYWIERGLNVYETLLKKYHRATDVFSIDSTPTLPDFCLIPQCYNANRFKVNLNNFPLLNKVYQHALSTEACQKSAPEAFQP